jgi:hypothetical protein
VVRLVRLSPHKIMRYRLRTLLIVLALGPMLLALGYWAWPLKPEAAAALRPPLFPITPEEQAEINAWIDALPGSPSEK